MRYEDKEDTFHICRPPMGRGQQDPAAPADPRGLREYVDLDAPSEDNLNIDYGLLLQKKS